MKILKKIIISASAIAIAGLFSSCISLAEQFISTLFEKSLDAIFYNDEQATKTAKANESSKKENEQKQPPKKQATYRFHDTVEYLPLGTDGTRGTSAYYAYFGDWPQTIMEKNITIDEENCITVGYMTYYVGSDGNYYAKCTENASKTGLHYSSDQYWSHEIQEKEANQIQYFKVEPIKWLVLEYESSGETLLVPEKILMAGISFYDGQGPRLIDGKTIYPNNYNESRIRAYLNGLSYQKKDENGSEVFLEDEFKNKGFLQTAFTGKARKLIAVTEVDNSAESTDIYNHFNFSNGGKNDYACEDSSDRIFLLSVKEALSKYNDFFHVKRGATDYALANNAGDYGIWLLRSPWAVSRYENGDSISYVNGYIPTTEPDIWDSTFRNNDGILPALKLVSGNKSKVKYKFHETVEYLPKGTNGTCGKKATYVYFGDWPQTIKSKKVTIDESNSLFVGAMLYFVGSDGNYYAKCKEGMYKPHENSLDSERYKYSDGTPIAVEAQNSFQYFKVEPIKWRVGKTDESGKKLLISESVIDGKAFFARPEHSSEIMRTINNSTVYPNNYKESEIRAYLNGLDYWNLIMSDNYDDNGNWYKTKLDTRYKDKGFLQSAFSKEAQSIIVTTKIDNNAECTRSSCTTYNFPKDSSDPYVCEDTDDKIFLLSVDEVLSKELGFSWQERITFRKTGTDYAKANGIWLYDEKQGTSWGLRTRLHRDYEEGTSTMYVNNPDSREPLIYDISYYWKSGIAPAITVREKQ